MGNNRFTRSKTATTTTRADIVSHEREPTLDRAVTLPVTKKEKAVVEAKPGFFDRLGSLAKEWREKRERKRNRHATTERDTIEEAVSAAFLDDHTLAYSLEFGFFVKGKDVMLTEKDLFEKEVDVQKRGKTCSKTIFEHVVDTYYEKPNRQKGLLQALGCTSPQALEAIKKKDAILKDAILTETNNVKVSGDSSDLCELIRNATYETLYSPNNALILKIMKLGDVKAIKALEELSLSNPKVMKLVDEYHVGQFIVALLKEETDKTIDHMNDVSKENINSLSTTKHSMLQFAIIHNQPTIVKELIEKGADINQGTVAEVTEQMLIIHTPVDYCIKKIFSSAVDNVKKTAFAEILESLMHKGAKLDLSNYTKGELQKACSQGTSKSALSTFIYQVEKRVEEHVVTDKSCAPQDRLRDQYCLNVVKILELSGVELEDAGFSKAAKERIETAVKNREKQDKIMELDRFNTTCISAIAAGHITTDNQFEAIYATLKRIDPAVDFEREMSLISSRALAKGANHANINRFNDFISNKAIDPLGLNDTSNDPELPMPPPGYAALQARIELNLYKARVVDDLIRNPKLGGKYLSMVKKNLESRGVDPIKEMHDIADRASGVEGGAQAAWKIRDYAIDLVPLPPAPAKEESTSRVTSFSFADIYERIRGIGTENHHVGYLPPLPSTAGKPNMDPPQLSPRRKVDEAQSSAAITIGSRRESASAA